MSERKKKGSRTHCKFPSRLTLPLKGACCTGSVLSPRHRVPAPLGPQKNRATSGSVPWCPRQLRIDKRGGGSRDHPDVDASLFLSRILSFVWTRCPFFRFTFWCPLIWLIVPVVVMVCIGELESCCHICSSKLRRVVLSKVM